MSGDAAEGGKVTRLEEKAREFYGGEIRAFHGKPDTIRVLAAFAQQCIDEEREACARLAEGFDSGEHTDECNENCHNELSIADAIRARGEKGVGK